jgi:hypothetical protein
VGNGRLKEVSRYFLPFVGGEFVGEGMATNVLQLGEVADFEALTFNLALNFF